MSVVFLKLTLLLTGSAIMFLGLNIGLGGIQTLGWQMSESFVAITNETVFHVHDSHMRFVGGMWFSVGVVFFLGAFFSDTLGTTLIVLCVSVACSALFRFSDVESGIVLGPDVLPSLALELVWFPLLGWWLYRSIKRSTEVVRSGLA